MATRKTATKAPGKKPWTIMVYLAGDNNLDSAGVVDLGEMKQVGSTDQINIVAQFDRSTGKGETRRFYLRKGTTLAKDALVNLGETNMGDPKVLQSFLEWGVKNYPAQRYMLVIWNHGAGWDDTNIYRTVRSELKRNVAYKGDRVAAAVRGAKGSVPISQVRAISARPLKRALFAPTIHQAVKLRAIAFDDDAKDFLDNIEMKRVLVAAKKLFGGKLSVLGMDACLMSMVEVAYQVRDTAEVMVGSQQVEPGAGWPYHTVLKALAAKPTMTAAELGQTVVARYLASYGANSGVTQAALNLSASAAIGGAIDKLAAVLLKAVADSQKLFAIVRARKSVQTYETRDYVDLLDFCRLLSKLSGDAAISQACSEVEDKGVHPFVLASGAKGADVAKSNGVSIYFPVDTISPLYAKLDFCRNSKWNEFLAGYFAALKA
jgi:hypothetical protein